MRRKTTLSIAIIAVAVVGFIAVTANDRISAQPFGRGQFQTAGSWRSSCDQQPAFYGGSRNARQGRAAGRDNWMRGSGGRFAASQGCTDCDSGAQGCAVQDAGCNNAGHMAQGCDTQRWSRNSGCGGAGGCENVSSCNTGRGRGRGCARGNGMGRGRNAGCGAGGSGCGC